MRHCSCYHYWYIDGPRPDNRRFLAVYSHGEAGEAEPSTLPCLLKPAVVSDRLRDQSYMLHWLACINWAVSPKQDAKGQIDRWLPVFQILDARRGMS